MISGCGFEIKNSLLNFTKIVKISTGMGNQGNCADFCDNNHSKQTKQNTRYISEIRINELPIECQICSQEIEHINFKTHLDIHHYAAIQEKNMQIVLTCLLCENTEHQIEDHCNHLQEKHPYVPIKAKSRVIEKNSTGYIQTVTNQEIKAKVKSLRGLHELNVVEQKTDDHLMATYQGRLMDVWIYQKPYSGMEYDENIVMSELIWFPMFSEHFSKAKGYFLEKRATETSILCKSYIVCDK